MDETAHCSVVRKTAIGNPVLLIDSSACQAMIQFTKLSYFEMGWCRGRTLVVGLRSSWACRIDPTAAWRRLVRRLAAKPSGLCDKRHEEAQHAALRDFHLINNKAAQTSSGFELCFGDLVSAEIRGGHASPRLFRRVGCPLGSLFSAELEMESLVLILFIRQLDL